MIRVPDTPEGARWLAVYNAITAVSNGLPRPVLASVRRDMTDAVLAALDDRGELAPLKQ